MMKIDGDGKRLCDIQAELFEKSVFREEMGSEVFVRRFMNSTVAKELDSKAFLDDGKRVDDIFAELDRQYGKTAYGSLKYGKNVMYWVGYLYRYFCYTYELSSKQAYRYLPLKYVASAFDSYHSLDVPGAIERLLEAKGISFKEEDVLRRGVDILRAIRNVGDPYRKFPVLGNERFLLRKVEVDDDEDLLRIYSDEGSAHLLIDVERGGGSFTGPDIERMRDTISFWEDSYENGRFVRWAIVDKGNGRVIGTVEESHCDLGGGFANTSLLRLDLRGDYEKRECIRDVLRLLIPSSFNLFYCDGIVTKSPEDDAERGNALLDLGFRNIGGGLIGQDGETRHDCYVLSKRDFNL